MARKKQKIVYKCILLFVLLLIPPVMLSLKIMALSHEYILNKTNQLHRDMAVRSSEEISTFMDNMVQTLFLSTQTKGFVSMNRGRQEFIVDKLMANIDILEQITVFDAQKNEIIHAIRDDENFKTQIPEEITKKIFNTGQTQESYISPVYYSRLNEPFISIAVPIKQQENSVGILSACVNLHKTQFLVSKFDQTGLIWIADKSGNIIMHPDVSFVLEKKNARTLFDVDKVIGKSESKIFSKRGRLGRISNIVVTGVVVTGLDWNLFVEQSESEVFKLYHDMKKQVFIYVLYMFLICLGIGVFFGSNIVYPIKQLQTGIRIITEGDLDYRVETESNDELGELSDAFNHLTENLKKSKERIIKYERELQESINERTIEIETAHRELKSKYEELERFNRLAIDRELKMITLKQKVKELEYKLRDHEKGKA